MELPCLVQIEPPSIPSLRHTKAADRIPAPKHFDLDVLVTDPVLACARILLLRLPIVRRQRSECTVRRGEAQVEFGRRAELGEDSAERASRVRAARETEEEKLGVLGPVVDDEVVCLDQDLKGRGFKGARR